MRTAEAPPRFGSAGAGDYPNIVEHSAAVILEAATHRPEVVVVDGNHEYYDTSDGGGRALDAAYRILGQEIPRAECATDTRNTQDVERSRFRFSDSGIDRAGLSAAGKPYCKVVLTEPPTSRDIRCRNDHSYSGCLPEASDTMRRGCVEHIVKSGKIAPQAVPDLILNLHGGHGSEVAS